MKQLGSLFQVPLLEPDPYRQKGFTWHLRSPLPTARPLGQLSLMQDMGGGDLPPAQGGMTTREVADGMGEGACGSKGSTAGQEGRNLSKQHLEGQVTSSDDRTRVAKP